MPVPLEICLEELDVTTDEPFIRCVALPGSQPGLALDREGAVRWMPDGGASHGLWVSADEQLVLLRAEGALPLAVARAGRSVEAPTGKPVVLLDGDELRLDGRRWRVHVHGPAAQVHPPERISRSSLARMARAAAAALAVSTAVGVGAPADAAPPIEIRTRPPDMAPTRRVLCTITKMEKKGQVMQVDATCPGKAQIPVGTQGQILDGSGQPIRDGAVTVKQSQPGKLVGECKLAKPVKETTLRFTLFD